MTARHLAARGRLEYKSKVTAADLALAIDDAAAAMGSSFCRVEFHDFANEEASAIALIDRGSITVHCSREHDLVIVDICICDGSMEPTKGLNVLFTALRAERCDMSVALRPL